MLSLTVKQRKKKNLDSLRQQDLIPAVLYGPRMENQLVSVETKEFSRIYQEAGESSMIKLKLGEGKSSQEFMVLIKDIQRDPVTDRIIHIDFYQPQLDQEIEATVNLVFDGVAPAVKELGGILVKNIPELEVVGLPQKLPSEIKVNVDQLKTFEDHILVKDLDLPEGVKPLREPEDVVVLVTRPMAEEKIVEEEEEVVEEQKEKEDEETKE
jgi:large subunit ribosomal protein L25